MARTIREINPDGSPFDGVVQAYEVDDAGRPIGRPYTLMPGDPVPDGVQVGEHALAPLLDEADELGHGTFDPGQHNARDVLTYLDGAPAAERRRVLALEAEGHARKTVLDGEYADLAPKVKRLTAAEKKAAEQAAAEKAAAEAAVNGQG